MWWYNGAEGLVKARRHHACDGGSRITDFDMTADDVRGRRVAGLPERVADGVGIGERLKKGGVGNADQANVGADAEGLRENSDEGGKAKGERPHSDTNEPQIRCRTAA